MSNAFTFIFKLFTRNNIYILINLLINIRRGIIMIGEEV